MQEDIVRLIELQKIDLEILRLEKSVAEVPQALKKAKKERDLLKEKINVLEKAIEEKEKQKNLFEEELKEEQKRLKQTQARLTQIRGSRDYQILLREIDEMKKTIRIKEDEILKLMEEIENLSKERDNLKNQLEKVQAVLEEETKKFEKFCEEINAEKESLLKKRKEIAEKISGGVLRKYELIRQKKGGVGIAAVENGVCEGCFMSVPPQLYNELQKDNRFYECPHCKRIIYFKRIYHKEEEALPEES
ncbi:MAG: zinc ribbon domain-containing protein [Caldimicrobium sp.]|jgi:predicted  nucleic acid-binding Zn-ribbon protein